MNHLHGFLTTSLLVLAGTAALAEAPPVAAPIVPGRMNADRLRWLEYTMVAGRIAITSDNVGTNMTYGPTRSTSGRRERLVIQIHPGQIDLHYELATPEGSFSVVASSGNKASNVAVADRFVLKLAYEGLSLDFAQQPGEPLAVEFETGGVKRRLVAPSFWHLYLADPEAMRAYLLPALEVLHPSWQLGPTGAALEETLLARAAAGVAIGTARWARQVEDLASSEFTKRAAAQRELFSAGQVILPYLQALDRRKLDAEQNARVRSLIDSLTPGYQDSTERLSVWLAGDAQIWLALLARGEVAKRRLAARQLSMLQGAAIDFDPEADPATREQQWQRLRDRIIRDEPADPVSVPPPNAQR